jgi:hypothetical protein
MPLETGESHVQCVVCIGVRTQVYAHLLCHTLEHALYSIHTYTLSCTCTYSHTLNHAYMHSLSHTLLYAISYPCTSDEAPQKAQTRSEGLHKLLVSIQAFEVKLGMCVYMYVYLYLNMCAYDCVVCVL